MCTEYRYEYEDDWRADQECLLTSCTIPSPKGIIIIRILRILTVGIFVMRYDKSVLDRESSLCIASQEHDSREHGPGFRGNGSSGWSEGPGLHVGRRDAKRRSRKEEF